MLTWLSETGQVHTTKTKDSVSGITLLMQAVLDGNERVVEALLRRGANVNMRSSNGHTALTLAVCKGNPAVVRRLLQAGADAKAHMNGLLDSTRKLAEMLACNKPKDSGPCECVRALTEHLAALREEEASEKALEAKGRREREEEAATREREHAARQREAERIV